MPGGRWALRALAAALLLAGAGAHGHGTPSKAKRRRCGTPEPQPWQQEQMMADVESWQRGPVLPGEATSRVLLATAARQAGDTHATLTAASTAAEQQDSPSVVIPLWFHVIIDSAFNLGNVSDSTLLQQLAVMNKAYGPGGISFRLDGINRAVEPFELWAAGQGGQLAEALVAKHRKGSYATLNVFVRLIESGVMLGYTNLPSRDASDPTDAVHISYPVLPNVAVAQEAALAEALGVGGFDVYTEGDTLVHEVGHWLGLFHTFQGGCSKVNDGVVDTAPTQELYGCPPAAQEQCGDKGFPGLDAMHNYMSYYDDRCMFEFTAGQYRRMRALWYAYRAGR